MKNQSFKHKARLQRVASATTEMNREIDAEEISGTNVNELPDDLKESIIHVTDDQLVDDPSNISLYGEYEEQRFSGGDSCLSGGGWEVYDRSRT